MKKKRGMRDGDLTAVSASFGFVLEPGGADLLVEGDKVRPKGGRDEGTLHLDATKSEAKSERVLVEQVVHRLLGKVVSHDWRLLALNTQLNRLK